MKALGLKTYRFSVAWPRVFPQGTGTPNPKGLDFYNRMSTSSSPPASNPTAPSSTGTSPRPSKTKAAGSPATPPKPSPTTPDTSPSISPTASSTS